MEAAFIRTTPAEVHRFDITDRSNRICYGSIGSIVGGNIQYKFIGITMAIVQSPSIGLLQTYNLQLRIAI